MNEPGKMNGGPAPLHSMLDMEVVLPRGLVAAGLGCLFVLAANGVSAQEAPLFEPDYDALTEELPIESEVSGPRLTFTNSRGGVATFYGQFNLAYQSFDDGQNTTSDIVDNGNWNSRPSAG